MEKLLEILGMVVLILLPIIIVGLAFVFDRKTFKSLDFKGTHAWDELKTHYKYFLEK